MDQPTVVLGCACGHSKQLHHLVGPISDHGCSECDCPRFSEYDPARPFRTSCASCGEILHNVDGHSQGPVCPHCGGVTYA